MVAQMGAVMAGVRREADHDPSPAAVQHREAYDAYVVHSRAPSQTPSRPPTPATRARRHGRWGSSASLTRGSCALSPRASKTAEREACPRGGSSTAVVRCWRG